MLLLLEEISSLRAFAHFVPYVLHHHTGEPCVSVEHNWPVLLYAPYPASAMGFFENSWSGTWRRKCHVGTRSHL